MCVGAHIACYRAGDGLMSQSCTTIRPWSRAVVSDEHAFFWVSVFKWCCKRYKKLLMSMGWVCSVSSMEHICRVRNASSGLFLGGSFSPSYYIFTWAPTRLDQELLFLLSCCVMFFSLQPTPDLVPCTEWYELGINIGPIPGSMWSFNPFTFQLHVSWTLSKSITVAVPVPI
jgi:hypothetical protein